MTTKYPVEIPADLGTIQLEQRGLVIGEETVWAEPDTRGFNCSVPYTPNTYYSVLVGDEQRDNGSTLIGVAKAEELRREALVKLGVDPDEQPALHVVKRTVIITATEPVKIEL